MRSAKNADDPFAEVLFMKSPFPGMDPYLEDQGRWPDFHASTYDCAALSDLPDDYVAQMGEEVGRELAGRP